MEERGLCVLALKKKFFNGLLAANSIFADLGRVFAVSCSLAGSWSLQDVMTLGVSVVLDLVVDVDDD